MTAAGMPTFFSHRFIIVAILWLGIFGAVVSCQQGRGGERERAEAEFASRAVVRHALTREILGHYEDALFGLSAAFMVALAFLAKPFTREALERKLRELLS